MPRTWGGNRFRITSRMRLVTTAVALSVGLGGASRATTQPAPAPTWRQGLAVQLWSFNAELKQDVPAALAHIKALGFDRVETVAIPDYPVAQLRTSLDRAELRAISAVVD